MINNILYQIQHTEYTHIEKSTISNFAYYFTISSLPLPIPLPQPHPLNNGKMPIWEEGLAVEILAEIMDTTESV